MRLDTLAAVILAYGTSNKHAPLASTVLEQGVPPEQLVVVHNPDRLPDTSDVYAPAGAQLVRMPRNAGYAAALNRGIAEARRRPGVEAVMLLTHDVELDPGALPALVRAAAAHPRFGVLAPVLRQPTMRPELSYGSRQWSDGSVGHITDRPSGGAVAEVPWVDGSAMLVRVAALEGNAPLPEGYFMYFEEAYLCAMLARRGWRTGSVPAVTAESAPGGSSRPTAYGYLYARNGLHWARTLGPTPASGRSFARNQLRRIGRDLVHLRNVRASIARLHGLLDALCSRSGPPPVWVRRDSDISGV